MGSFSNNGKPETSAACGIIYLGITYSEYTVT
jgi:hypothetical protein